MPPSTSNPSSVPVRTNKENVFFFFKTISLKWQKCFLKTCIFEESFLFFENVFEKHFRHILESTFENIWKKIFKALWNFFFFLKTLCYYYFLVKMHFWSLHFELILYLVPNSSPKYKCMHVYMYALFPCSNIESLFLFCYMKCTFGMNWIFQFIFTFNLFLLLFISLNALFDIIHESHYTIQLIFQLFFFTLLAKSFQFQLNKLFQIDTKYI